MRRGERPLSSLPASLLAAFAILLGLQIASHRFAEVGADAAYRELPSPFDGAVYHALAMGSERLLGYLLAIRLQLHDNQAGRHWDYDRLDGERVVAWLETIGAMDRDSEYPMLLASRIYSQTGDDGRLRRLIAYIERGFADNPARHWRRLAEASLLARHRLGDLPLALRLARRLAALPETVAMPRWARDFEFLILAELNELEAAIAIIEALLGSGSIDDPDEAAFLRSKLSEFRQKLFESRHNPAEAVQNRE